MTPAAWLQIIVQANTGQANAALAKTQAQLTGTAKASAAAAATTARKWQETGRALSNAGRSITRNVSLPAAAAGAASVKMAVDFEESMSKVRNLVGASERQTARWSEEILALAPKVGKAPKELADALYFVSSSGIKTAEVMEVVTSSAKAAALGLGETEVVADAVTSAMNAYSRTGLKAAEATNILALAVKEGKGEPEELADSIGRIIPIAAKLRVPFNDVGASLASMTLQGLDAAEATTALRGIFSAMFKPTQEANEALASVGLSAGKLRNALAREGTLATLQMLSERFKGNIEQMAKVFPNIRGLVGAFNLTGDSAKKNAEIFQTLSKNTDVVNVGFQRLSRTEAHKLRQTLAGLQASAIKVGEALLPVVGDIADVIGDLASGFASMPKFARNFLIGAILLGPLIRSVGALATAYGSLRAAAAGAAAAQAASGTATAAGAAGSAATVGKGIGGMLLRAVPFVGAAVAGGLILDQMFGQGTFDKKFADIRAAMRKGWQQILSHQSVFTARQTNAADAWIDSMVAMGDVTEEQAIRMKTAFREVQADRMAVSFRKLEQSVAGSMRKITGITDERLERVRDLMIARPEQGRKALIKTYDKAIAGVQRAMDRSVISTERGVRQIVQLLESKLRLFGFKGTIGSVLKQHLGKDFLPPQLVPIKEQRGGVIVPGSGSGDKIPALLEPGEVVWNRKAVAAMGGAQRANAVNRDVPRFAQGGIAMPQFSSNYGPGYVGAGGLNVVSAAGSKLLAAARTAARQATGGGQHRSYPMLSGDTDFVPALGWALSRMARKSGTRISVTSGFRTYAEQAALFAKYGSPRAAPPGRSNHEDGRAADISPGREVFGNAGAYGLTFPMSWEPWHIELLRRGGIAGFKGGGRVGWRPVFGNSFDKNELTTLAKFKGLPRPALMAAIAMGESSGIPGRIGDSGNSVGLWQIHKPSWGGSNEILRNPFRNAEYAKRVLRQQGLSAWTIYNTGAYRRFLGGQVDSGKLARLRGSGARRRSKQRAPTPKYLPIPRKLQERIDAADQNARRFLEFADRAGALEGPVGGMGEAAWLGKLLDTLFILRERLVWAHQLIAGATKRMDRKLAGMKAGPAKDALRKRRSSAKSKLGEIDSALRDIQGTPTSRAFKLLAGQRPALGVLGGQIFDTQIRLRDLGRDAAGGGTGALGLSAAQLRELTYLKGLGVRFTPGSFGGFFANGGMLGAGRWGIAGEAGPEAIVGPAQAVPLGSGEIRVVLEDHRTAIYRDGALLREIIHSVADERDQRKTRGYLAGSGTR